MPTAEIRCINKRDRQDPYAAITNVGGVNPDGKNWKLTQAEAIDYIESKGWSFYVERPKGDRVYVEVAVSARGNKYLKTEADGDAPNNLLSLPECP